MRLSCLAICARQARATSTGENFFLAKPFASLAADFQFSSIMPSPVDAGEHSREATEHSNQMRRCRPSQILPHLLQFRLAHLG